MGAKIPRGGGAVDPATRVTRPRTCPCTWTTAPLEKKIAPAAGIIAEAINAP